MAPWKLSAPLSGSVAVVLNGEIVLASGLDAQTASVGRVQRIDPATGAVVAKSSLPRPLHDAAGDALGGRALLVGGGQLERSSAGVIDLSATPPEAIGSIGVPRSDLAAVTVGDQMFVMGGYDGSAIVDSVLSSTDGVTFTAVGHLAVPVRYGAAAAVGDRIYLFGGRTHDASGDHQVADIQMIDTTTGAVTQVGSLPEPNGHQVAAAIGNQIYLFGGRVGATNPTTSAAILRFDPSTNTVTPAGQLPAPASDMAGATIGDTTYLLGGTAKAATDAVVEVRVSS